MNMNICCSAEEISDECKAVLSTAPTTYPNDLPAREDLLGASDWYYFEHQSWAVGEKIRHSFKANPKLRHNNHALQAVMSVIEQTNLRRGRQSFVMALGNTAAVSLADRLARFLADKDIQGQVVGALLKMRASRFVVGVRPLMEAEQAWVRNLAGKYVKRYSSAG